MLALAESLGLSPGFELTSIDAMSVHITIELSSFLIMWFIKNTMSLGMNCLRLNNECYPVWFHLVKVKFNTSFYIFFYLIFSPNFKHVSVIP